VGDARWYGLTGRSPEGGGTLTSPVFFQFPNYYAYQLYYGYSLHQLSNDTSATGGRVVSRISTRLLTQITRRRCVDDAVAIATDSAGNCQGLQRRPCETWPADS